MDQTYYNAGFRPRFNEPERSDRHYSIYGNYPNFPRKHRFWYNPLGNMNLADSDRPIGPCASDEFCGPGQRCDNGVCRNIDPRNKSLWLSHDEIFALKTKYEKQLGLKLTWKHKEAISLTEYNFFNAPKAEPGYKLFKSYIKKLDFDDLWDALPKYYYFYVPTTGGKMLCERTGTQVDPEMYGVLHCYVPKGNLQKYLLPIGITVGLLAVTGMIMMAGKKK